jgi:hypothetical protein
MPPWIVSEFLFPNPFFILLTPMHLKYSRSLLKGRLVLALSHPIFTGLVLHGLAL